MTDIIVIIILVMIAGAICRYLYRAKKRGEHCIGCPHAKECQGRACNANKK